MATITFSGLSGSGLDTSSWVDALVSVKQTTITSLQAQQEAQQKLLSVVNNIKSFFSSFQTCLQKITDSQFGIASLDLFMQNLATSSNTNILTATATTDAARQTYDVLVEQLATSTKATSGYTKTETKYATLNTTLGELGAKSGTVTVNNQSFTVSEKDTIKDLIGKFSNAGVVASFDSKKCRFTVGAKVDDINDGTTGLKAALGLQNTQISGITSGSIVYANKDTKLSDLGLTAGKININGAEHNIQKSGTNYTIQKAGGTKVNINTINDFLNILKTNFGADATIDNQGNISIRGCVIESVAGGSNLKDVLNLGDVKERTVMTSNPLTWQKTNVASLTTTLKDLGITGNKTLSINGGTATNIADSTTLQTIKNTLATLGIDMTIDENGVISINTNGVTISGTLLDALGLVADKNGTTLTSNAHTVTYKATGSTKLSDLSLGNTDTYTAYKSDGTAITGTLNNVAGLTIDEFISQLKSKGLDASFNADTQQIIVNDGYITGTVADKLGMTSTTETHQETATVDTTLEKLGAIDKQTMSINGGTAKEYEKTAKLSDVIKDITDAGGKVEFKDGRIAISGVTLSGTLPALLGFSATTQGTSVTSGALSVVTNSSSTSSSEVQETQNNQIALTTKLGTILGLTSGSRTLAINGGTSVSYDVTSKTLNDVKTAVETAGGTLTINDDNTITIKDVTLSGTLVTALGLASVGTATSMTSNRAITVGGVETLATTTNTLADLGATGDTTLSINGGTAKTYDKTTTLSTVFSDIAAAGGTAEIKDGVVSVSGVNLSGTVVDILGLQATQTGTEITSGDLTYTASTASTSSSALKPMSSQKATETTKIKELGKYTQDIVYVSDVSDFESGKTYHIKDRNDLTTLADLVNAGKSTSNVTFVLDNDINMGGSSSFVPIGTLDPMRIGRFRGTFDGQGYSIENYMGNSGIFGIVEGATIKNVGIDSATMLNSTGGALVYNAKNSEITNCWVTGAIIAGGTCGGLIGEITDSTVSSCLVDMNIQNSTPSSYSGNLIGKVNGNCTISNSGGINHRSGNALHTDLIGVLNGVANITNCFGYSSSFPTEFCHINDPSVAAGSTFTNCLYSDNLPSSSNITVTNCAKASYDDICNADFMAKHGFSSNNNGWTISGGKPKLMSATKYSTLFINGEEITSINENSSLKDVAYQIRSHGGTMTINDDGSIEVSGVQIGGGIVDTLGLTSTHQGTTIKSNTPITLEQSFLVEGSNTIGTDLGVAADKRSYAIYDNYGNVIAETSDTGATGNATVSQWLASVNTKMNTYYGTTGVEYAKISNGVISVNGGYIKGDLASAIGMTTTSTVSGKALVGNAIQIKENSKFIGQVTDQTIPEGGQRVGDVSSFTAGETYYLSDYGDITRLAYLVNTGIDTTGVTFVMTNDIDMSGLTLSQEDIIGKDRSKAFKGTFLGNGYEIKNINFDIKNTYLVDILGLFGYTDGATIKDLGLSNVTINNENSATTVGTLIGKADDSTIENCYVSGGSINFSMDRKTSSNVGGLVGWSFGSSINNCFSSIDINVDGKSDTEVTTGGLVGYSFLGLSISNSYSLGNITQSTQGYIGGFVGLMAEDSINNCYSMGNVKSTSTYNNYVGGFVGDAECTITNAYATGKVETAYEGDTANIGGFVGVNRGTLTNCVYNRDSGTVNNGAGYADQGGAIGYSLAQINAEGNGLPKLTGNNPYIYRGINTRTTLAKLGLSSADDRTITVNIDGVESTNTFDSSAKIQDVLDYLNGLSGVNATFENAQFKISANTTKNISVGGKLATTLFGDSITETNVYETHNTNDKLYYSTGTSAITNATRVGDLLKTNAGGTLSVMIDDTTQITLSYDADATVGDILTELSSYGINATITTDGKFQATSSKKIVMSGDISRALIGANGTVTYTDNGYTSAPLTIIQNMNLNGDTKLSDLNIDSGNIQILDKSGNLITNLDIDNSKTLSQLSSVLSAYGFTTTIDSTDKKVTITSDNGNRLANSSSNLVSQLKLDTWTDTTDNITNTTTLAEMGFNNGSTMTVVLDGTTTMNLSFGANNTIDDIITALGTFGIDASIVTGTTGNTFSATSNSHSFVLSGEIASYLTQGGTYINQDVGYKSNPLTYNTSTTPLTADTTIADLLGGHEGGTLRLTLDGNVINLNYNADDTVQNVINDLANLGINATISNTGVFSATSNDKTFVFSGDIGRALQGNAPIYTQLDKEYKSKDLSYNTTSNITNNSILKDIGITSGSIFLLDRNGNVINSIDIDENMTINQTKAALKSYGIDMSLTDGKVTISSNDGYSLTDGSSNMISMFKLPAFTQTTAKLTNATTLAQMGFKEGTDLNLLLDGSTPTTISFGATDTMQDIMNSLQALGINCSIDATNGAFTATSTEHSFVFSGDLGKFLTSGTAGYINSDKGYMTNDPLMVDVPVVTQTSSNITYSHSLKATDTVESMGFANGGVVRLILDGSTPYSFSFLATDTMQDIMDTLATYGIDSTIDADGKISFQNNDHTFTLGGELGTYLTNGGAYTNNATGYTSSPLTFKTTENCDDNTKLSDLGASSGALNIIKDGQVAATIQIDADTTIGQLKNAIKPYGMIGTIGADNKLTITSEGDTYLADGTCDAVTKLGLNVVNMGDYNGHVEYWQAGATSGLLTEDMLLTSLDKDGKTAVGSLIFELGTGDDKTQHIVNITATDTIKSFLDKMEAEGVHAVLDNGVIKFDNSVDGIKFTGGSSGISDTLGLTEKEVSTYATSSRALTYQEDVTYSVANYADKDTLLSTVNVTSGKMSIFVDGVKAEVQVNETDKFSDVFSRIVNEISIKTGVTARAGFVDTDGNIMTSTNFDSDKNTGIIGIEVVGDHTLVVGASNDKTNFATIANLKQQTPERVTGSRALYKVNGNSLITTTGLFKNGDITEGKFTIGDATFTIDGTTTLNSLINQINKSDKSYASAYWDTLSGTLVIQSTLSGESLINIESGTSNFTKVMGFTETVAGKETLVTERQTLGQNAIVKINGTTVTSTSNTITSDISKIKGLTINLKGVSAGETVTIKVEQDNEGIYNAVNDIVDSYNTLMEGLEKELGKGGSFEHDTMFNMMKNQLKRLMTQSVGGTTTYRNLAAIGISTGEAKDSISTDVTKLLVDKDKFLQALEKDSDAVKQLLVGTTANSGVFLKVGNIVDSTLKTTGYIASTENSINKNIKKMSTKITNLKTALDKYREQLETKFRTMEKAISTMQNSYSSFLKS